MIGIVFLIDTTYMVLTLNAIFQNLACS